MIKWKKKKNKSFKKLCQINYQYLKNLFYNCKNFNKNKKVDDSKNDDNSCIEITSAKA